jgi:hypothetical protein
MLMRQRLIVTTCVAGAAIASSAISLAQTQPWNNPGFTWTANDPPPVPPYDLSGIWDAGTAGISGPGHTTPPLTTWGEQVNQTHRPGNGPRMAPLAEINDPLSILCAPAGFPLNLLYELRPFEVVQLSNKVLMLYMFEQRWRTIWTDGRPLPQDPDPRWYGYSVGKWEDERTFVVETIGLDEQTWLDNAGNPHSAELRVEERYRRVAYDTLELTVAIDDPKAYTEPWLGRDRLPLRLLSSDTDFREMICSPAEAREYQQFISDASKASQEQSR